MSVPCAYRLYQNEDWSRDQKRRQKAGVPKEIAFATKWEIALSALDSLLAEDIPHAPVVADAGYDVVTAFRGGLTKRRLSYAVVISAETGLWPPGMEPLAPNKWSGRVPAKWNAEVECQNTGWDLSDFMGRMIEAAPLRSYTVRAAELVNVRSSVHDLDICPAKRLVAVR
jgi:SRSO17 transposase